MYGGALHLSEALDARDRGHGDTLVALAADALLAPHLPPRAPLPPPPATLRAMLQVRCPTSTHASHRSTTRH